MNCSFNIRYKPRTTRAFTKSDLTVYDSAGNTALNALTVYGKSEVVDGSITSAGEGYRVVKLADLTWSYIGVRQYFRTELSVSAISADDKINGICSIYKADTLNNIYQMTSENKTIGVSRNIIFIKDTDYTDATAFKNSLNGLLLCYQLADPTQGNAIAIKTDNGYGIDGTMATFSTGTPLRATLDGQVKDEMRYNGITGEVITRCEIVNDEVVPLATPIITPLTAQEITALAGLRTFTPTTHAQNNAQTDTTVDYTIRVPTI